MSLARNSKKREQLIILQNNFLIVTNRLRSVLVGLLILSGLAVMANPAFAQSSGQTSNSEATSTPLIKLPGQADEPAISLKPANAKPDLAFGAFQRGYYLSAFNYALPRAEKGDAAAQTLIGELYEKGLGIRRDPKEATSWYKLAAESGSSDAQFSYALKLLEGKYVARDEDTARDLMKRSADAGHAIAQFNYAQMLVDERPTSRGFEIALGYFDGAAQRGVAEAYFSMAQIYSSGYGTTGADEKKARQLMLKAAKNSVTNAQIELAIWMAFVPLVVVSTTAFPLRSGFRNE